MDKVNIQPDKISFEYLDAKKIKLFRAPHGSARMTIEDHDRSYLKVTIAMAFPLTKADKYIGFLDALGNDIGTIENLSELNAENQIIVKEELKRRYFLPKIIEIIQLNHEYDISYIKVKTDHGIRDFSMRGHRENCVEISPGRFIMEDIDGNRFEIPDISKLSKKSQSLLSQII